MIVRRRSTYFNLDTHSSVNSNHFFKYSKAYIHLQMNLEPFFNFDRVLGVLLPIYRGLIIFLSTQNHSTKNSSLITTMSLKNNEIYPVYIFRITNITNITSQLHTNSRKGCFSPLCNMLIMVFKAKLIVIHMHSFQQFLCGQKPSISFKVCTSCIFWLQITDYY